MANPECRIMLKEERQALTDRCINDLYEYLVFHGKERQKEGAFALILERLEREMESIDNKGKNE